MKNQISLSGMANDMRHLGRPVRRVLAVFVAACAVVLLLAAGSPPLQAQARTAPEDEQVFHRLVVGQRMNTDDPFLYVDFVAVGRFKGIAGLETHTGSYSYSNTGVSTGDLVLNHDDGDRETLHLVFTSMTAGTLTEKGDDQINWRLTPISESELTTLYFPDYVDGGGWSVQLALSHIAATTEDVAILVTAYDRDGQSIPGFFDFESPFGIPPLGTRIFRSAGAGEARRGWIEVKTDTASVSGLLTYRNTGTGLEVSVEPVELGNHFALFVEESSGIGTGLAIFKPDPASTIEFRIRDEDGINPLGEGFVTHPVGGETFQQRVGSIPEWFDVDGIDTEFLQDFQGILLLRSEDGSLFAPVGIRFGKRGESLSAVPVIPILVSGGSSYDRDGDGLIEIANLAQLNAIRWDLNGDGEAANSAYESAFPDAAAGMGCPSSGCSGYELTADLDFDTNSTGSPDSDDAYWNEGQGWDPIGGEFGSPFIASFDGGGHTISNLYIVRDARYVGLFGIASWDGLNRFAGLNNNIRNVALVNVDVHGGSNTGGLVGDNSLTIAASYVTGSVHGGTAVGGLAGNNFGGTVIASYSAARVSGVFNVGGLVGSNFVGRILASYSTGSVTGTGSVGGLVGSNFADRGTATDSYWDAQTSGQAESAGGEGKTTSELQSPTGYTGIYANWNLDLDDDSTFDDLWDFGTSSQYPVLSGDGQRGE